ncbi:MAG: transcription antitermination factor NusB [Lachnospiraceae bacterium]|nr:transcription antitermination factor NusB [Lachnospiraceae bacterium]
MGKRAIRERIFLILFRVDYYRPEEMPDQITHFFEGEEESYIEEERLKAEEEERELGEIVLPARITGGRDRIREKTLQIVEHLQELDKALDERMEGWNLKRIGKVELTILRLALFEMRYDDEVSDAVAINEAVELAKKYGQDKSGEFVNGVLAKFAKA